MNDRKHSDLSMWEYLAYIGNRYYGPNGQQRDIQSDIQTATMHQPYGCTLCIEEWMCAWKACMEGSSLSDR